MQIFVTGGTGLVGSAVVKRLIADAHQITTLARSDTSADIQRAMGANPVRGSLTDPADWVALALEHDAIIHAAATFENDMGDVDHSLVSSLLEASKALPADKKLPFLYTGGCWLYPEAPVIPITERHVLDPLPEFAWMLDSIEQLQACPNLLLTVIHPALVVNEGRGLIADYARDLTENGKITITGSLDTHFPFIQAGDLADLYARALSNRGDGLLLNATGIKSATAKEVGLLVAQKLGLPFEADLLSVEEAQRRYGSWASGFARSQRMVADRAMDLLDWKPSFDQIEAMVDNSLKDINT